MRPIPTLVPVPPTPGQPVTVDRSPFWIGSGSGSALKIHLPTIGERHASITEREDGYYLSPFPGAGPTLLDRRPIGGPARLVDGQIVELGPTARFEYVSGEPRVAPEPEVEEEAEPEYAPAPAQRRRWFRRRRRRSRAGVPVWAYAAILLIVGAVGAGGYYLYTLFSGPKDGERAAAPPLTPEEGQLYDRLMAEATRSIERGSMLLDLGLEEAALQQFSQAISTFEASDLSSNAWVRPSIEALVESVRRIYQENKGNVPSAWRNVRGQAADLSRIMSAALTTDQFAKAMDAVRTEFKAKFGRDVVITGSDHAEHLSLYGRGGALDIRVRDLTREQVDFLISTCVTLGVRVKDFSRDEVLQAQIAAAKARGWNDRAGTGLHIHVDRFRDRRDRWTVS
ncbi:MAG: FHA domain-containing protein [Gemmatimonadales bacterium]